MQNWKKTVICSEFEPSASYNSIQCKDYARKDALLLIKMFPQHANPTEIQSVQMVVFLAGSGALRSPHPFGS
jgi:hypothetical protein